MALLATPELQAALAPGSLAEAPLAGRVGGVLIAGQVDRLMVQPGRVLVLDYKTNRPPPASAQQVPALYLRQMAAYRAVLRQAFPGRAVECALAIAGAGADELVVHARTKAQAYRPPAYWERVADVRAAVSIPVVANGEIWNVADALRCRELSGCHALMLGRGMVSDPGLALAIVAASRAQPAPYSNQFRH